MTGASLGYLAEPLRMIEADNGDRVRMTMNFDGTVALRLVDSGSALTKTKPEKQLPLSRIGGTTGSVVEVPKESQ